MPKPQLSDREIKLIIKLRKDGMTLSEILKKVPRSKSTVFKYIEKVKVSKKVENLLSVKKKGSTSLSLYNWRRAEEKGMDILNVFSNRDYYLILTALYWGEGNKKEFNIINGDPSLIKVVFKILLKIGVPIEDIKISLRLYSDLSKDDAIKFWSTFLNVKKENISSINILEGRKKGKLKYGMCRLRIKKGGQYFKLIMSMIDLIRRHFKAAVVQRIEQDTPNV